MWLRLPGLQGIMNVESIILLTSCHIFLVLASAFRFPYLPNLIKNPPKKKTPTPLSQILSVDFRQRGKAIQERKELSRLHGVGRIVQPTRLHKRSIPTSMHTHRIPKSALASSAAKNSLWRNLCQREKVDWLGFLLLMLG